jgi:hypothetical protein
MTIPGTDKMNYSDVPFWNLSAIYTTPSFDFTIRKPSRNCIKLQWFTMRTGVCWHLIKLYTIR